MNMQEKLQQAERLLNEVKEEMAKATAANHWPQEGDEYWVPASNGGVKNFLFGNDGTDKSYFVLGLAFKTKEEATAEVEARKVVYELKQQPGVVKFTVGATQWTIKLNQENHQVYPEGWRALCSLQDSVWFESREAAQSAIEAVGKDRVLKAARWWTAGEV